LAEPFVRTNAFAHGGSPNPKSTSAF
jgi:hypothetical protein